MTAYSYDTLVIYVKAFLIECVESCHFLQHCFLYVCLMIKFCAAVMF